MDRLKETISKLILLEMLFRFVKIHILDRDSFYTYRRFKTFDYDDRHDHDNDDFYDWNDDSLANMYQD